MSPAIIATAVALPVILVVALIVAAVVLQRTAPSQPVPLSVVPAPDAESEQCASVVSALPDTLGDLERAELLDPAPVGAAAWRLAASLDDPVVLRCGLDRPLEFDRAAALQIINGVEWFEASGAPLGIDSSTWYAVDRGIYIALTVPNGSGPTPLQVVSDTIADVLPPQPIDPAPIN
ncbi:DUF3515 domain-containing protein [Hoyosella rhizosphaerae]|uniref:Membrane protein n=1 Tax=Hoyosella rhizosphaerae TaxID=1755582 RepID=A0A916X901_9ACTN|nr:DUF3515 domain-containing protein [Hoyosella rhizosphaerae]GGC52166.1 membrane protein [Hoyosella rhizosphaerae]